MSQKIALSEYLAYNTQFADEDGAFFPALEFINTSEDTVLLSDYELFRPAPLDTTYGLPAQKIAPGSISVLWLSGKDKQGHSSFEWSDPNAPLILIEKASGLKVDSIQHFIYNANESISLNPDFKGERYFSTNLASLGHPNPSPGPWRKIQTHAGFTPGDSAPMGCLVFDNKLWILSYETVDQDFVWNPVVEVWNSEDGINWTLVNSSPPYAHKSMFVVFNDYMWAFDGHAHRSKDGIHWEDVSSNTPYWGKMTTFKNEIWAVQGSYLYKTGDGINWTLVREVPWYYRGDPVFLEHEGMLYMMGGSNNYGTIYEFYWQDVWRSQDGVNWEVLIYKAPWEGNLWPVFTSFDGKIWLMGGASSKRPENGGNTNAIWYTEDGIDWNRLILDNVWSPRHAQFIWNFQNSIWIAAGYEGGGPPGLFSDVWKFTKLTLPLAVELQLPGVTEPLQISSGDATVNSLDFTYGDSAFKFIAESQLPVVIEADDNAIQVVGDSILIWQAGAANLTFRQESTPIYDGHEVSFHVTVHKKDLHILAPSHERNFFEENPDIELTYDGFVLNEGPEDIDELPDIFLSSTKFSPPGTYPILLSGGFDANYTLILHNGQLTIRDDGGVHVFPNPATDQLNIVAGPMTEKAKLTLINSTGATALSDEIEVGEDLHTVSLEQIPPGMYFLNVIKGSASRTVKIIVN